MEPVALYFYGCILIALSVIYESVLLKKLNGQLKKTKVLTVISLIQFSWLIVSCVILFNIELKQLQYVIPTLYVLQSFVGWFYGFHLLSKAGVMEKLEKDEDADIFIPLKYTDFNLSYGFVLLIATIIITVMTIHPNLLSI